MSEKRDEVKKREKEEDEKYVYRIGDGLKVAGLFGAVLFGVTVLITKEFGDK